MEESREYEPYVAKEHIFYDSKKRIITVRGEIDFDTGDINKYRKATTLIIENGVRSIRNQLFCALPDNITSLTLPDSVIEIGENTFAGSNIETFVLPARLLSIGRNAFALSQLKSIELPASVTMIGEDAFNNCFQLVHVKLPENLETIPPHTFSNCKGLKSVTLPRTLKTIERFAFDGCSSIEAIDLPESIKRIESDAFRNCSSLKTIYLPDNIEFLGKSVFEKCDSLKSISLTESAKEMFWYAFEKMDEIEFILRKGPERNYLEEVKELGLNIEYSPDLSEKGTSITKIVTENLELARLDGTDDPHLDYLPCAMKNHPYRVAYISDLHLDFKVHAHAKEIRNSDGLKVYLYRVCEKLIRSLRRSVDMVVFLGDISPDIRLNELFIAMFSKMFYANSERLGEIIHQSNCPIIYILGNHELWGNNCKGKTPQSIIKEYQKTMRKYDVRVPQNELLIFGMYSTDPPKILSQKDVESMTVTELRSACINSNAIMLCGLGFTGKSKTFNANNGIYRNTLDFDEDLDQTDIFYRMHAKCREALAEIPLMVFTHTATKDWLDEQVCPKWTYFHGHTHHNSVVADQYQRIFSDAQVGYNSEKFEFKIALSHPIPHPFIYLGDGIYEISNVDYIEFNRSVGIGLKLNKAGKITMLKKAGYYLFIMTVNGMDYLLEGGRRKTAEFPISYYYEKMDNYANNIASFMEQFHQSMAKLSKTVRSLGGSGYIHGCIIDIDYYNHLYVNPLDWSITSYYATSMRDKWVYRNFPSLLATRCPDIYKNYQKLLSSGSTNLPELAGMIDKEPVYVDSTEMYANSRLLRCYQYSSDSHIIRNWSASIAEKDAQIKVGIENDRIYFYGDGVSQISYSGIEIPAIDIRKGVLKYIEGTQKVKDPVSLLSKQYCDFVVPCLSEFDKLFKSFEDKLNCFHYSTPGNVEVLFTRMKHYEFPRDGYPELIEMMEKYSETGTIDYRELPISLYYPEDNAKYASTSLIRGIFEKFWAPLIPWNYYRHIEFDYDAAFDLVKERFRAKFNKDMPSTTMEKVRANLCLLVKSFEKMLDILTPLVPNAVLGKVRYDRINIPYMEIVNELGKEYSGDVKFVQYLCNNGLTKYYRLLSLEYVTPIVWEALRFALGNEIEKETRFLTKEERIDLVQKFTLFRIAQKNPIVYIVYGTVIQDPIQRFVEKYLDDYEGQFRFFDVHG